MKTAVSLIGFMMLCGFAQAGCTGAVVSCQTIYNECEDAISAEEEDFVDECVDEYFDEDSDCKEAVRDFARCVDDDGCNSPSCVDEYWDIAAECGVDALQIAYES